MPKKTAPIPFFGIQGIPIDRSNIGEKHPDFLANEADWDTIRDSMRSQSWIKSKGEKYLPRPAGMTGVYASAYDAYIERAHYPQISPYVLQGSLGIILNKLPEFTVPPELEYLLKTATKDGDSLSKLFIDAITEVLQTGKCPLVLDIVPEINQFRFVRYKAEAFPNWKEAALGEDKRLILAVFKEAVPDSADIFSHDTVDIYRVLVIADGVYQSIVFDESGEELPELSVIPSFTGKTLKELPVFIAGSVTNSTEQQPIPLLSVANIAIDIYRKEADLANSEFLSCNPTLCMVGASNDDNLPNVVGSSVMIVLPDPQARIFYTETDTAALTHVRDHIADLYEEAIRHGVAILDARKGVESAEAMRIRMATQAASIYSMYLSVATAVKSGLQRAAEWMGLDPESVAMDIPSSLIHGVPDAGVIREIVSGFGVSTIPLNVVYRYMVGSGLIDSSINYDEYVQSLMDDKELRDTLGINAEGQPIEEEDPTNEDPTTNPPMED